MRRLLVLAVAVLALGTAAASPATTGPSGPFFNPAWSPDGAHIAWSAAGGGDVAWQIWTSNPDGSGARQLIGGLRNGLSQIVWPSPDEILYDANFSVVEASPTTRAHRAVLPAQGSTFTTDAAGDRVASTCDRCNGPMVVVDVATGKRVRFGGGDADANSNPTLSPDGTQIVFDHAVFHPATENYTSYGLWIASSDGSGRHLLTANGSCEAWSPTGDEIAFQTLGPKGLSLREIRPDGTGNRLLLKHGPTCSEPASYVWSPDGKQIAYVVYKTGRLAILNAGSRQVTPVHAFAGITGIAWSPDSQRLLVSARPDPNACSSLWTVGADGKGATLVRRCS